jgi:hypothetical protein
MAIYDQLFGYLGGSLLVENTSLEISYEGENGIVITTALGYDGESPNAKFMVVNFENVHPPAGFTFDVESAFLDTTEVEFKAQSGASGKQLVTKGFIQPIKTSSGVGKVTSTNFAFRGKAAKFE